jgi:hypothetical protein
MIKSNVIERQTKEEWEERTVFEFELLDWEEESSLREAIGFDSMEEVTRTKHTLNYCSNSLCNEPFTPFDENYCEVCGIVTLCPDCLEDHYAECTQLVL